MPVRFDAASETVYRLTNLPSWSAFTIMAWAQLAVDRDANTLIFGLLDSGGTSGVQVVTQSNGTTLRIYTGTETAGASLVVGTWVHLALVKNGSNYTLYVNGTSNITHTDSLSITPGVLLFSSSNPAGWFNGRLAHARVWGAALSQSEVQAEMYVTSPARTTNLNSAFTFVSSTTADSSGNGYNLTAYGSPAIEGNEPFALIVPSGITSAEAFGTASVATSGAGEQTISPSGIASGEAFGTATVERGAVNIAPTGIAPDETFGTAIIGRGAVTVAPSGIASIEAFGLATIGRGAVNIAPTGITSGETFGAAVVGRGAVNISPGGIASGEVFGAASVGQGAVTLSPTGIASSESFGTPVIGRGAVNVAPGGIASSEAFGSAAVTQGGAPAQEIAPMGIVPGETFGAAVIGRGAVTIAPAGIASTETLGTPVIAVGAISIAPLGIVSAEAFGTPTITPGGVVVSPSGIASGEAFGVLVIAMVIASTTPPERIVRLGRENRRVVIEAEQRMVNTTGEIRRKEVKR